MAYFTFIATTRPLKFNDGSKPIEQAAVFTCITGNMVYRAFA